MGFFTDTLFLSITLLITYFAQISSAVYCSGYECVSNADYCCGDGCCSNDLYYSFSFWNLWYFWFVMFIVMMTCCGMCSYAKRRQYYGQQQPHGIVIHGGANGGAVHTQQYPVGVVAPPMHMPHGHPQQMHPQQMPPQANQMPPAYNEVTSKPELYPSYQTGVPYPAQQPYPYYAPQPQPQFAYPPPQGPPTDTSVPPPAYAPSAPAESPPAGDTN